MVNLDEFKYAGTNLTAFRLLDPDREEVKHVVDDWIYGEMRYGRKLDGADQTIKVICRLDVTFHTFINVFFFLQNPFSVAFISTT